MNPELLGLIGIPILILLMFIGIYVSVSMAIIGFAGVLLIAGSLPAFTDLYMVPFSVLRNSNFAVLTLFIAMSEFISMGGLGSSAFNTVRAWIGHMRGGLAVAAVGACGLFAATSGSSMACAVVMGKVAFPEMKKFNYSSTLATGCIAAGGSVGIMIPPSTAFVVIGLLTNLSIGKLFMAGILPGITQVIFYGITIAIVCRLNPKLGPSSPNLPFKEKMGSLNSSWPIIALFLLVMGGIYLGIFTPTESAAIGATGALIIGFVRKQVTIPGLRSSLDNTVKVSGMMLLTLTCAYILIEFLAISRLPFIASDFIVSLGLNRYIVLSVILAIYIFLGAFFDIFPVLILTIPILFPIITAMKFDPIWYGVLMCRTAEMGFITPPFGINLFALNSILDIPLGTLFRGVIPFIIADLCHVIFLVALPSVATFIPNAMV